MFRTALAVCAAAAITFASIGTAEASAGISVNIGIPGIVTSFLVPAHHHGAHWQPAPPPRHHYHRESPRHHGGMADHHRGGRR